MGSMDEVITLLLSVESKRSLNNRTSPLAGGQNNSNANVASNFEVGTISQITTNGYILVQVGGAIHVTTPTSDEEFKIGQRVWTAKTVAGVYITIGGARQ